MSASTAVVMAMTGAFVTVVAPSSASAATACAANVFTRQFFANTTFSGAPKKTDCDSKIDQDWGAGAPASGLPSNDFGVRWQLTRDFGSGGPFTFTASSRDGIRVYLDGVRKVDLWKNVSTAVSTKVDLTVPKGEHTLRVDYVNWTGSADVTFAYAPRTSATVDKVAPLAPTGPSVARDAGARRNFLKWTANKEMDVAGYRVYRRTPGQTSFGAPLATVTGTSFTDTTSGGTTHLYEVRAFDKAGNESSGSSDVSVTGKPVYLRQFFANTSFSGTPARTDTDSAIDQNWGTGTAASGLPVNDFGVRWQVTRDFGSGGPFTLTASGQDGIRVYLDGVRKIDLWKNGSTTVSKTVNLTVPQGEHTLRVDYVNWTGAAAVKFDYTPRTDASVDQVPPLTPTGLRVAYDENTDSATFSWAANTEMDRAYYRLYQQTAVGDWAPMVITDRTTWTATGLPRDGRILRYYLVTSDRAGNVSEQTPALEVATVDTVVPAAPALRVSHLDNTPHTLKVNWDTGTEKELRNGGVLGVYRSTGGASGDDPELIGTVAKDSSPTWPYAYMDELPAFDGTAYTYTAVLTDAAGNASPRSTPVTVTPDGVAPAPLTGLTATPRADGVLLSWDTPAETGLRYAATRVVRGEDGSSRYDSRGCSDAVDPSKGTSVANALLCVGPADGETVTFAVVAYDAWGNGIPVGQAPTVTVTELDHRPDDARGAQGGPLTVLNPDDVARTGRLEWGCTDEVDEVDGAGEAGQAVCADIATYRLERWNAATGAYETLLTVAADPARTRYPSAVTVPTGSTTFFRITGTLADGTTAAVTHYAAAKGSAV
ncbi:PA14 domain-containing protein [Streptomyces sp. UH6]|uniref:PA14 domain-containing protein n=1 Tax=Streptomyces sp. UH6 TaxID=2748379 RepID=UPI0015D4FE07|nr:PA14 domain-containing protein [Streptomyces sp. UH6]NYV73450.1 hypothetical protein [Streptomyces sp. UH6]